MDWLRIWQQIRQQKQILFKIQILLFVTVDGLRAISFTVHHLIFTFICSPSTLSVLNGGTNEIAIFMHLNVESLCTECTLFKLYSHTRQIGRLLYSHYRMARFSWISDRCFCLHKNCTTYSHNTRYRTSSGHCTPYSLCIGCVQCRNCTMFAMKNCNFGYKWNECSVHGLEKCVRMLGNHSVCMIPEHRTQYNARTTKPGKNKCDTNTIRYDTIRYVLLFNNNIIAMIFITICGWKFC